jgi:hypothetical protein
MSLRTGLGTVVAKKYNPSCQELNHCHLVRRQSVPLLTELLRLMIIMVCVPPCFPVYLSTVPTDTGYELTKKIGSSFSNG